MRFLHISDLHLGKMLHGVSLLENGDQPYWVLQFLALAEEVRPQAVVISGDVYDRSSPSGEAVSLLSQLVEGLAQRNIAVLMVAGNHDSGQRLSFARELLAREQIHIAGTAEREMARVTLTDEYGPVTFWLMPYVFPAAVAQVLQDDAIRDYDGAVRRLLAEQQMDAAARNVIVAHQNVTAFGAEAPRGGSESAVGGVGQVEYTAFDAFDYAALGHIHGAYSVGRDAVRYAGSPMCYHFNETRQARKGPVLVELGRKGEVSITTLEIQPLHPMRELRGPFETLREQELAHTRRGEYLRLVLTDRPLTPEAVAFFQSLAASRGSVLMEQTSEYRAYADLLSEASPDTVGDQPLEALFSDFFASRTGSDPDPEELALLHFAGELLRNTPADPKQRSAADPKTTEALLRHLMPREVKA